MYLVRPEGFEPPLTPVTVLRFRRAFRYGRVIWWASSDSNRDSTNYEFAAITNYAKGPIWYGWVDSNLQTSDFKSLCVTY